MLLLVTLALVVASAVLLILGFVQDALGFIYLSMLCAGVAALALFVFARLARRRSAVLAGAGVSGTSEPVVEETRPAGRRRGRSGSVPATGGPEREVTEFGEAAEEPVTSTSVRVQPAANAPDRSFEPAGQEAEVDVAGSEPEERREAEWASPSDTAATPAIGADEGLGEAAATGVGWGGGDAGWTEEADDWSDWGDEVVFPIEDYDELRVAEILPLLGQLEPDELQEVRDRELAGKARATILDRIDDRLGRGAPPAGEPVAPTAAAPSAPARTRKAAKKTATARRAPSGTPERPAPAKRPSTKSAARRATGAAGTSRAAGAKSAAPAKRAAATGTTPAVTVGGAPTGGRAGAAGKAATKKAVPAKATPAKATPAKASPAKGTPAKGTPAKATPAKASPAKGTPAKATPAKATPAKATPAKATPAKAATAKRGTPAEAPAKKAAARKSPAKKTTG